MKAAAPLALFLPSVQKKIAAKAPAQPIGRGSQGRLERGAADAFFRIVRAKLDAKPARAAHPQGSTLAEALEAAAGGLSAEQAVSQASAADAKGAALAARKKAARANGVSSSSDAESPAVCDAREGLVRVSARQGESRRDSPDTSTASTPISVRRGSEPKLYVLDLRKTAEKGLEESRASGRVLHSQVAEKDAAGLQGGGRAAARETAAAGAKARTGRTGGAPAPFESALDRLRAMAGSELVKTTGIILRDGGGEIRLVLKPESLGSVRVRMNLVDNGIEGRIIVDTPAVKQALDGSIDALARALTAQGFQSASLEVSVGGQSADGGRTAQEAPSTLRRESADGFERNVPGIESVGLGDLLVNLFV